MIWTSVQTSDSKMNINIFSLVLMFFAAVCAVHGAPSSNNIINIRVLNGRNHTNKLNLLLKLRPFVESSAETNVEVDIQQNPDTCRNNETRTRQIARIPQEDPVLPGNGHTLEWPSTTRTYRRNTTAEEESSTSESPATTLDGTSTHLFPGYELITKGPPLFRFTRRIRPRPTRAVEVQSTSESTTELPTTTREVYNEEYRYIRGYGFYKFKKGDYDWATARRECQNDGGDLMVPDSYREREVVYREMNPEGYWVSMGVHDPGRNGSWVTVHGDPVPESWWAPGEPASEGEYCGRAHTTGELIVASCSAWRYVLCELSR